MKYKRETFYLEYRNKNYTQGTWIEEEGYTTKKEALRQLGLRNATYLYSWRVVHVITHTEQTILSRKNAKSDGVKP